MFRILFLLWALGAAVFIGFFFWTMIALMRAQRDLKESEAVLRQQCCAIAALLGYERADSLDTGALVSFCSLRFAKASGSSESAFDALSVSVMDAVTMRVRLKELLARYNDLALTYNAEISKFPTSFIAELTGKRNVPIFKIERDV